MINNPVLNVFSEEYLGRKFTKEEKTALLGNRNLGKTLELKGRDGKKFSASLQIDAANCSINFSGFKQEKEQEQKAEKKRGTKLKESLK